MRAHRPSSKVRRAAFTARSMSSLSPSATRASTCPVAGLTVSKVLPDAASTHLPSISILRDGVPTKRSTAASSGTAAPMASPPLRLVLCHRRPARPSWSMKGRAGRAALAPVVAAVLQTPPVSLRDQAAIVGIGQLPFSKDIGRSEEVTALEAAHLALEDAGLKPSDIDGMMKWSIQPTGENVIARNLGVPNLRFFGEVGYGGGGGCGVVGHAAAGIAAGMARCVLVYRSRNRGSGGRPWAGTSRERDNIAAETNETALFSPYGFVRPADQVAMFARRFLHERGYTTRHLGWIAVAMRRTTRSR